MKKKSFCMVRMSPEARKALKIGATSADMRLPDYIDTVVLGKKKKGDDFDFF